VHGDLGQHLAVDAEVLLVQRVDQAAVGGAVQARGSIDTHDPQATVIPLLKATVAVGMGKPLLDVVLRNRPDITPLAPVTLGELQYTPATFTRGDLVL